MRRKPGFRTSTSDLQLARPQLRSRSTATRRAPGLSVDRCARRSTSAFGTRQVSTIYTPANDYPVILEADPKYADTNEALRRI